MAIKFSLYIDTHPSMNSETGVITL